jgi:hypothetical protein
VHGLPLWAAVRRGPSAADRGAHLRCMSNRTASESGLEPLMNIDTLSQIIGVPIKTIKDWRLHGKGPAAYKIGNHLRYAPANVRAWLERCRELEPGLPGQGR